MCLHLAECHQYCNIQTAKSLGKFVPCSRKVVKQWRNYTNMFVFLYGVSLRYKVRIIVITSHYFGQVRSLQLAVNSKIDVYSPSTHLCRHDLAVKHNTADGRYGLVLIHDVSGQFTRSAVHNALYCTDN